jgi:hypothetical protein
LEDVSYSEGRNPHQRKAVHHFDNAPIHKNGHGTVGAVRIQEDGASAQSSGFGPVELLDFWVRERTIERKELYKGGRTFIGPF